ncbi:MAG: hypothetical protein IKW18_04370, partial [Clostridia bacterium]|nr:hypothetical protein [Clostridia bacterium]
ILAIYIGVYIASSCIIFGGLVTYQTEQIYESYQSGYLYTDVNKYDIQTESHLVDIHFSEFLEFAQSGDSVQLTVSKISGELIAIQCDGKVLYKVPAVSSAVWIQQPLFLSLIGTGIFMLIAVNIKNPKGFVKKMQEEFQIISIQKVFKKTEWHYPLYKSLVRISVRQNNKKQKFWYHADQLEQIENLVRSATQNVELQLERKRNKLRSFTVRDTLNDHMVFTGLFE